MIMRSLRLVKKILQVGSCLISGRSEINIIMDYFPHGHIVYISNDMYALY
jgi:hypothetical protein